MVVSQVGALTKEFCMAEIWTWGNDGSKRILRLMGVGGGGRGNKVLFVVVGKQMVSHPPG